MSALMMVRAFAGMIRAQNAAVYPKVKAWQSA